MNCPNCGAAMDLIESRRHFRCRHCGTYHFSESVEADGLRIVGQRADAPRCPVCTTVMAHAVLDEDHPVDFCAACRGVLLPRSTFAVVVGKRRAWATTPPGEPVPFDRLALARELACPRCKGRFETYPHLGPGNVVIDNCTRCDVIWLDFGEMRQIVDAPGKDRGSRHVPRIDNEYVRGGQPAAAEDAEPDPLKFLIDLLLTD